MGNSLVGIAPSQIFPLEHYMADIAELQLEKRSGQDVQKKSWRLKKLTIQPLFTIHSLFSILHSAFQPGFHPVPKGWAGPPA